MSFATIGIIIIGLLLLVLGSLIRSEKIPVFITGFRGLTLRTGEGYVLIVS